jgi:cob(I)alamin adenosyltransferase
MKILIIPSVEPGWRALVYFKVGHIISGPDSKTKEKAKKALIKRLEKEIAQLQRAITKVKDQM